MQATIEVGSGLTGPGFEHNQPLAALRARKGGHRTTVPCVTQRTKTEIKMDSRNDPKTVPPVPITCMRTLHETSFDGSFAHQVAASRVPSGRDRQPNIGGIWLKLLALNTLKKHFVVQVCDG